MPREQSLREPQKDLELHYPPDPRWQRNFEWRPGGKYPGLETYSIPLKQFPVGARAASLQREWRQHRGKSTSSSKKSQTQYPRPRPRTQVAPRTNTALRECVAQCQKEPVTDAKRAGESGNLRPWTQ